MLNNEELQIIQFIIQSMNRIDAGSHPLNVSVGSGSDGRGALLVWCEDALVAEIQQEDLADWQLTTVHS